MCRSRRASWCRHRTARVSKALKDALAIDPAKDPENQLVILIGQRRAKALLDNVDAKFSKN